MTCRASSFEAAMNRLLYVLIPIMVLVGAGATYYWWQQLPPQIRPGVSATVAPPAVAPSVAEPPVAEPATKPPIEHPIEVPAATARPLPSLDESDAHVRAALNDLLGSKAVLSFLRADSFIRRIVATVDNLARPHAAPRLWPVDLTRGRFSVDGRGENSVVSAENARRYAPFVAFVESVDTQKAAAVYTRLYPLFQAAYEQLGYPGRYFNDRLVAVIDHLLATPEVSGPLNVELTEIKGPVQDPRPWVRYRFSDPAFEALSGGQKILLRMGPDNQGRLKAMLSDFRRHVAGGAFAR
jgi:hypothetical protein